MGEYTNRLCVVGTDKSEVGENNEPIDLTVGVIPAGGAEDNNIRKIIDDTI